MCGSRSWPRIDVCGLKSSCPPATRAPSRRLAGTGEAPPRRWSADRRGRSGSRCRGRPANPCGRRSRSGTARSSTGSGHGVGSRSPAMRSPGRCSRGRRATRRGRSADGGRRWRCSARSSSVGRGTGSRRGRGRAGVDGASGRWWTRGRPEPGSSNRWAGWMTLVRVSRLAVSRRRW